jgi:hypothetical protein
MTEPHIQLLDDLGAEFARLAAERERPQPTQEMREAAAAPGIGLTARLEARGHAALELRATSAYEEFVAPGGFRFRRRDDVERLDDVVKFRWEMVSRSGEVAGVGLEFLVIAPDGRIQTDYQFIES